VCTRRFRPGVSDARWAEIQPRAVHSLVKRCCSSGIQKDDDIRRLLEFASAVATLLPMGLGQLYIWSKLIRSSFPLCCGAHLQQL